MNKTETKMVIVGCEPTGCYWLNFQKFLQDHDIQIVTVNQLTVNEAWNWMITSLRKRMMYYLVYLSDWKTKCIATEVTQFSLMDECLSLFVIF